VGPSQNRTAVEEHGVAAQIDRGRAIPGTSIFDGEQSRRGYRINKFCMSLADAANRAAFKADEEGYLARSALTEEERELVRRRDFKGLGERGGNTYFMMKLGACTGFGLYHIGAQMRGETYDEFLATRSVRGAT
jgi:protocatechuate 4,5-dioxygenase, alpha chain